MNKQEVKTKKESRKHYSITFKKKLVQEYNRGLLSQSQLRTKYGIGGKSTILNWCQKYGNLLYIEKIAVGRMAKDSQKQRIKNLERMLKESQLKVIAYQALIETAEKEEGISILKKEDAKQSVSLPKPTPEG